MARMDRIGRRDFLRIAGGCAAFGWLGVHGLGCGDGGPAATGDSGLGDGAAGSDAGPAFAIEEATIAELQQAMQSGRASARSLCQQYLDRIAAMDRSGPTLRALLETNPEALAIADQLDAERQRGAVRGPLHGVPVLIKGNLATADRMSSTAGSLALLGPRAAADAKVAARLRAAGAILLGKTNLSEWANFRSTRALNGWSAQGGQCKNAYALDRDPCGSSSGTGAGIAANLGAVGIGTETDGSITCPSSAHSLVGLKPTVGLVSRAGIIPISFTQDTAGPMTRTVRDCAIVLSAIASEDPDDPATAGAMRLGDYTSVLDTDGLRGAKLALLSPGLSLAASSALTAFTDTAQKLGATITPNARIPGFGSWGSAESVVLQYEFKAGVADWLKRYLPDAGVKSLADLIAWNQAHAAEEMPLFGQETFISANKRGSLSDPTYLDALARCGALARTQGLDAAFAQYNVDAFVFITLAPPCSLGAWPPNFNTYISAAAVAGYPHLTVPAGFAGDLPIGVSFIGRRWAEGTLLRLGYAFEQATHHRQPARLLESASYEGC